MKIEVKFYVAGKVFTEDYIVNNLEEAKLGAKNRNPHAKIIGMNAVFR